MTSAGTRTVTIVTLVTLLFAPIMDRRGRTRGHELVGKSRSVVTVVCEPGDPCPARRTVQRRVRLDAAATRRLARRSRPYVVKRDDTLAALARRFGVSVRQLRALNGIRDERGLRAGSTLRIPLTAGR